MSTKRRAFAGTCDTCGHEMERIIEVSEGQVSLHGVLMRCAECREVSLTPARSSGDTRHEPPWVVERGAVADWFRYGDDSEGVVADD
jgi:hypothetical protein